ncbi:MAG TPA: DUF1579 family protein [Planctomycetota bacterium]|nr:DUF1579 family protein [Planctomycetota bacterium]
MRLIRLAPLAALALLVAAVPPRPATDEVARAKELLEGFVGTWDVDGSFMGMPSKGVETNTLLTHGLCIVTDYRAPMGPGAEFEGHGLMGYDPSQGKWLSIWADNTDPSISVTEGHWSADGKTVTVEETIDMGAGDRAMVLTTALQPDGSRLFTMVAKDAAPDAAPIVKSTYRKRASASK